MRIIPRRGIQKYILYGTRKLTSDGHTNMEFLILLEDGPELDQQPMKSRSKYDAYRRSHDGTRTTHEGDTKM